MGDPAGIGPEVIVKALADPEIRSQARYVVYGMNELLAYAADLAEIEPFWWRVPQDSSVALDESDHDVLVLDYDEFSMLGQTLHRPTRQGGHASLRFVEDAIRDAMLPQDDPRHLSGVTTAPICKESWKMAGVKRFPGHTELFAFRTKSKRKVMMFHCEKLMVALATVHIPLMDVRNVLTIGKVFEPIDLGHQACVKLGIRRPRIAVCGLNPHAGENGMFGDEEERLITPAIEMARRHGMNVAGPFPADTLFVNAIQGRYDMVIAMYHDQGLIPIKMLAFDSAVNVTLGLPILRTSVDHGTAFDIVGQNQANPGSMKAALNLAARFSRE